MGGLPCRGQSKGSICQRNLTVWWSVEIDADQGFRFFGGEMPNAPVAIEGPRAPVRAAGSQRGGDRDARCQAARAGAFTRAAISGKRGARDHVPSMSSTRNRA